MDNSSKKETMMFVALPGADPYAEVPKKQVKEQLDKGLMKQSALIWSQKHNSWKQARHITQLIANKLQPRPAQAPLAAQVRPQVQGQAKPAVAAQAKVHPQAATPKAPSVPKSTAAKPAAAATDFTIETPQRTPLWLKAVCAALVVIIIALIALNWYYVDSAIKANLVEDNTPFKEIPIYAHLGGFFQAGNVILHLRPTDKVTRENFLQYISAVAAATPNRPFSNNPFTIVSLSNGWSANYHIAGRQWQRLAKGDLSNEERRAILLENTFVAGGDKLVPRSNLDASGRQALEDKRWNEFVMTFVSVKP